MAKSRSYPIICILFLIGYLFAGCQIIGSESKDEFEDPECPVKFGIDPDPPPHCYVFNYSYPAWSPDGQFTAYITSDQDRGGIVGLYIYDMLNHSERLVIDWADNMSSQAWSPDGEWLTFSMGAQIYKIRADGSDLTRLTEDDSRAYFDPAWSPDGEWIVYSDGSVGGKFGIWTMQSDGSKQRWVAPRKGGYPNWIENKTIVTARDIKPGGGDYRFLIWDPFTNSEPDTLTPREVAINTRQIYNAMANSFIFQSQSSGEIDIWKIYLDGSELQRLTFNGGAHPAWSPDGKTIAYVNIDYFEGRGKIWLMDPDGTNRRPMINKEVMKVN